MFVHQGVMFTCQDADGNEISSAQTVHEAMYAAGIHLQEGETEVFVYGHDNHRLFRATLNERGTVTYEGTQGLLARYQGVVCNDR